MNPRGQSIKVILKIMFRTHHHAVPKYVEKRKTDSLNHGKTREAVSRAQRALDCEIEDEKAGERRATMERNPQKRRGCQKDTERPL